MSKADRSIFESLFQQYHPMVLQMCKGFTDRDIDLANDLSQEVFIHIWHAIEKFEGRSSYKTWIYRITVNTCLQYQRKRKKQYDLSITDYENLLETTETTNEIDQNQQLYAAIQGLERVDRLITMMLLEELDYSEIASIMGISESNLRVKIHRIKKKLRKILSHEK